MPLIVLVDHINPKLVKRYQGSLQNIHNQFTARIQKRFKHILITGTQDSILTNHKFSNMKELYHFALSQANGRDIVFCSAYAGAMSVEGIQDILRYTQENQYDVCFPAHLPEGLVPSVIHRDFIEEFSSYLDDTMPVVSSLNDLINWEFQGIDVGIYLSESKIALERISCIPEDKNSILFLEKQSLENISINDLESIIKKTPPRQTPKLVEIELCSYMDDFHTPSMELPEYMDTRLLQKILTELEGFAPEAVLTFGIWGDSFLHPEFEHIFQTIDPERTIYVYSRAIHLPEEYINLVLSRPNTELIIDISFVQEEEFSQYKKSPYSIREISEILEKFPKGNIWIQLTRAHETEPYIKSFMQFWSEYMPNVLITKADSFGDTSVKVVDLAPIKRHACFALRTQMSILTDGTVMLCRQDVSLEKALGNINQTELSLLWKDMNVFFEAQLQGNYSSCTACSGCDDWWIFP